jgi:hypothetical protein
MIRKLLLSFVLLISSVLVYTQTINHPNYGLKSHETLNIESVIYSDNSFTLNMIIENRSLEGNFCADKNIFIILPGNKKLKIISSEGIPVCPDAYNFSFIGEKLRFKLWFPAIAPDINWIDLIEDCNNACFSFSTIILDSTLNLDIDEAFSMLGSGKNTEAILTFEKLFEKVRIQKVPLEGNILMNLVLLYRKQGNPDQVKKYYQILRDLQTPESAKYIEILKNSGITF